MSISIIFRSFSELRTVDRQGGPDFINGVLTYTHRAMACEWQIISWGCPREQLTAASEEAFAIVDMMEDRLSAFRRTSDIFRLNQNAGADALKIDYHTYRALDYAMHLSRFTRGAFDFTTGALVRLWSMAGSERGIPGEEDIAYARERSGIHHLQLDPERRTARIATPGVQINLGAFGKGYALDAAIESLIESGVENALIHSGSSTASAIGKDPFSSKWRIAVRDPNDQERALFDLELDDNSSSTSGNYEQYVDYYGRKLGHVLDPRTGWPVEGILSATVVCESAAASDALSTAALVLGDELFSDVASSEAGLWFKIIKEGERLGAG